ncbi:MAG: type I methionyl aminopeptidase [Gammaproteobacteria bacterium]|nr:type I methionyl aminopeptidase [Gammaproteobacteria bacterium]
MPNSDPKCSIEKMREAGRLAAMVLDKIAEFVVPGVTTRELDNICKSYIINELHAYPACFAAGFPGASCISVNHVACHGIPGSRKLKHGDLVNIDVVVRKDNHHGDHSRMFQVGKPNRLAERLATATYDAMMKGITVIRPGRSLDVIGNAIDEYVRSTGFKVVRDYCGHGIGRSMHELPQVVHFTNGASGVILEPGMTFTVEPIVNAGKRNVKLLADGWTVVTKDHSLSAQWEHTVLVTDTGHEILTAA